MRKRYKRANGRGDRADQAENIHRDQLFGLKVATSILGMPVSTEWSR